MYMLIYPQLIIFILGLIALFATKNRKINYIGGFVMNSAIVYDTYFLNYLHTDRIVYAFVAALSVGWAISYFIKFIKIYEDETI